MTGPYGYVMVGTSINNGAAPQRQQVAKPTGEGGSGERTVRREPVKKVKIGRNDPCPCGSGLKWKKCTCKEFHENLES